MQYTIGPLASERVFWLVSGCDDIKRGSRLTDRVKAELDDSHSEVNSMYPLLGLCNESLLERWKP